MVFYPKKKLKIIDLISANYYTSLGGESFLPGFLGLGYVKNCQYFNVVIQSLSHLKKFRNGSQK